MKKLQLLIFVFVCMFGLGNAIAQDVVAEDNAANYTSSQFENADNLGTGFGAWRRVISGGDAAIVLQSAADNGSNSAVIDTENMSFGLRSSLTDATNQRVDLGRELGAELPDNHTFSFEMAWNWSTPGLTGFQLFMGGWDPADQVALFDFDVEGFFMNGELVADPATTDDWDAGDQWRQNGEALRVTFTRDGANLNYTVKAITERSSVDVAGVLEGVNFDRVNFFNEGRPNWGEGNPGQGSLFVNSLKVVSGNGTSTEKFNEIASQTVLSQNYPNPFNPVTTISYQIPTDANVTLNVFDMLGRQVMSLVNTVQSAGSYDIIVNAENLSSGVYLYRLNVDGFSVTRKFTLAK